MGGIAYSLPRNNRKIISDLIISNRIIFGKNKGEESTSEAFGNQEGLLRVVLNKGKPFYVGLKDSACFPLFFQLKRGSIVSSSRQQKVENNQDPQSMRILSSKGGHGMG